jgi:hypothetical protein
LNYRPDSVQHVWSREAYGRLDLFAGPDHYMIVDIPENLRSPQWQIAPFSDRRQLKPLNSSTFVAVL